MKKNKFAKKLNDKGFSMVEIIIVIAIIAILATVVAPQYFKHLESARETTDVDAYRNIVSALQVELINSDVESGTITFSSGTASVDNNNIKSLLSGVGINLDNVKMKSDKYDDCVVKFETSAGIISFSASVEDLATALGIKYSSVTP